jgi:hypothetical protein
MQNDHTEWANEVLRIEAEYGRPVVAVAYNADGSVFDHAFTWQTGQALALEGYRVRAIADDGHMSATDAQALYDAELDRYADCYDVEIPTTPLIA